MKDIVESLTTAVKERLSSPFIGSFIISWSIINWKFYVILLFGSGVEPRIIQVGTYVLSGGCMNTLAWPLILATTYTLGGPVIKLGLDFYAHLLAILFTNGKKGLDKKIAYTSEEFTEVARNYDEQIGRLNEQVKSLTRDYAVYRRRNPDFDELASAHQPIASVFLERIGEKDLSEGDLWGISTVRDALTRNDVCSVLNHLVGKNLIQLTNEERYTITRSGRDKIYSQTYGTGTDE